MKYTVLVKWKKEFGLKVPVIEKRLHEFRTKKEMNEFVRSLKKRPAVIGWEIL